jgi:excisionase family DNA binding protein
MSERAAYTMGQGSALTNLSIATLYAEIHRGKLRTIKVGGRRLIPREALEAYLEHGKLLGRLRGELDDDPPEAA